MAGLQHRICAIQIVIGSATDRAAQPGAKPGRKARRPHKPVIGAQRIHPPPRQSIPGAGIGIAAGIFINLIPGALITPAVRSYQHGAWQTAYLVMAASMAVGVVKL